jgi:hypothetical protein
MIFIFIFAIRLISPLNAELWTIDVTALNLNSNQQGQNLIDSFIIGEYINASNGYDLYDIPKLPPYAAPYIHSYILHTTWGDNDGEYHRDFRHTDIDQKIWNIRIRRQNPYTNNYRLDWEIPEEFPPYYNLHLIRGTTTINMRNQNSYSYSTSSGIASMQIKTIPIYQIPYIISEIAPLLFSNNLEQEINLLEHFGILNSPLTFSLLDNQHIVQEIVIEEDIPYWRFYPVPGWTGSTEVTINAYGNSGSNSMVVSITRDDTNSLPYYINEDVMVEMTQNLDSIIDLNNTIHDDDLDPVTINVQSGLYVQAEYDSLANLIHLTPDPAFKGNDVVTLILADNVNEPNEIGIEIQVLPSQPKAVQNIVTFIEEVASPERDESRDSGRTVSFFHLSWDEVTEDVNDLPLSGISYKVLLWDDPAHLFAEEQAQEIVVLEPGISIEVAVRLLFFQVTAVNP